MDKRSNFLRLIKENISEFGYHITLVNGAQNPNYAYTIGLHEKFGFELVIAGQYISVKAYENIFKLVVKELETITSSVLIHKNKVLNENDIDVIEMHSSWKERMILGAYDYYHTDKIKAYQIKHNNRLLDVPDMSKFWNINCPIWCWLEKEWDFQIPKAAHVVTNIQFLKGETITEIMRWKDDYWEMFVGVTPDVSDEDVRILPFGTMKGIDDSLMLASNLHNDHGLWRENKDDQWHDWE